MSVANRNQIEKLIYDTFDKLDPSGLNTTKYKNMLSTLDDKAFESWMKKFLSNDDEQFIMDIIEYDTDIKLENCEAAAKVLGVSLTERVFMPHITMDRNNAVVSKEKVIVGYINPKRMQQLLYKKNGLAVSNERTSHITGQVTGEDKHARDSDIEAAMLISIGADKIIQEFHGPRADDPVMRTQTAQKIAEKGYVELEELDNDPRNKVTLNTVGMYLLSMGLEHNLLGNTYVLPKPENYF